MEFSSGPGRRPVGGQPPGLPVRRHRMKRSAALLLVLALVAACETSTSTDAERPRPDAGTPSTSEEPRPPALVTDLPEACERWAGSPTTGQITFTARGRLFALDPADGTVRCIDRRSSYRLEWGGRGDRLLMTSGREPIAYGASFVAGPPGDNREITWSKPVGTSLVYVTHDYAGLLKEEVATRKVSDISFLDQHFDVAYHPAGMHIAVSGQTSRGRVGLFLATNEGTEIQQIVRGETADYIDGLEFSHDGRFLYFRADHGDRLELHAVRILTGEESADTERDLVTLELDTIYSGPKAPYWTVSPFSRKRRLLFTARCRDGREGPATIVQGDVRTQLDPELGGIDPVGWLPDGSVAFLAFGRSPCDDSGKGDLYLWNGGETKLLVNNVDAAAIRARLPDAPDPPARAQGVVA